MQFTIKNAHYDTFGMDKGKLELLECFCVHPGYIPHASSFCYFCHRPHLFLSSAVVLKLWVATHKKIRDQFLVGHRMPPELCQDSGLPSFCIFFKQEKRSFVSMNSMLLGLEQSA